jgi:hypothetical protein
MTDAQSAPSDAQTGRDSTDEDAEDATFTLAEANAAYDRGVWECQRGQNCHDLGMMSVLDAALAWERARIVAAVRTEAQRIRTTPFAELWAHTDGIADLIERGDL